MKKTALLLMIITIVSKMLGFTRDITLSYYYGASNISDAYLIALTIPSVIFSFIGTGISTGYIPLYSKIVQESGEEQGNKYTNNLVNVLIISCTLIIILGLLFTEPLVKLFASGFKGETLELAARFTKISILGIYFTGLISIFAGYLQLKGNYTTPAMMAFPMNLIIIASILLGHKKNIYILPIGTLIATASQLLLLIPFIHKSGYRYRFVVNIKDKYLVNMATIALPVIIGVSVNQINTLIDRTIASRIATGGISALNYASKLNGFVQGIFVTSISTVLYPTISRMAAEGNTNGLKNSMGEAISVVNLLILPATVGAMIFAEPVVKLLFGRGAFDSQAITMTSSALLFYSVGMIGFGLRDILSRAFYSLQDTKTPMVNAAIAMVMNIVLNIVLSRYMGIGGLALATSISSIFCTGLLFISLRKKIGPFGMKDITISSIKIILASLVMGILAKLAYDGLLNYMKPNFALIVSIVLGAIVYFLLIYLMKIKEVYTAINAIKNKFGIDKQ